jgi:hypothetical protein
MRYYDHIFDSTMRYSYIYSWHRDIWPTILDINTADIFAADTYEILWPTSWHTMLWDIHIYLYWLHRWVLLWPTSGHYLEIILCLYYIIADICDVPHLDITYEIILCLYWHHRWDKHDLHMPQWHETNLMSVLVIDEIWLWHTSW